MESLSSHRDVSTEAAFHTVLHSSRLRRSPRATARKAAGNDGWSGTHFAALPLPFFESSTQIWNLVLDGAPLPQPWLSVKVVGMPKPEGGTRPLALASLAWRLGATVLLRDLAQWPQRTLPSELCGSIRGRQVEGVHKALDALCSSRPRQRQEQYAGYKADLRRCYDQVVPEFAIQAWEHLGGSLRVASLLRRFYTFQQCFVSVKGVFSTNPVVGAQSLLQGCPFSGALLNSLTTVWLRCLRLCEPTACLRTYVDDRTIWVQGRDPVRPWVTVAENVVEIDACVGFQQHPAKLASFASSRELETELKQHSALVGSPCQQFDLLGLPYQTSGRQACSAEALTVEIQRRSRRIQMIGCSSHKTRAMLTSLLILSKLRFVVAWLLVAKAALQKWTSLTEQATWDSGGRGGRSAYLFWTSVAGVQRHPGFVVYAGALLRFWQQLVEDPSASPRANTLEALKQFGWKAQGRLWQVGRETLDVTWLSKRGFLTELQNTWRPWLWSADTKSSTPLRPDEEPCHQQHVLLNEGGNPNFRTAVGNAADGRVLQRLGCRLACACGEEFPSRTHLTFACTDRPWQLEPCSDQEQRLLTALVRRRGGDSAGAGPHCRSEGALFSSAPFVGLGWRRHYRAGLQPPSGCCVGHCWR